MVQDLIQCFICPSQFSNYEICIQHSQSYQFKVIPLLERGKELVTQALGTELSTEITALLTRAQILLHHGSESLASLDDINGIVRHEASGVDQGWDKESVPATVLTQPNGQVDATRRSVRIQCPHKDCDGEAQTFARVQELDRHYALHYKQSVQCEACGNALTAREAITHTCKDAAASQIMLLKKQRKRWRRTLREEVKKAQLSKDLSKHLDRGAGAFSYGEQSVLSSDYSRDSMTTGPFDLISSVADLEGSSQSTTFPPPQEISSLPFITTSKQSALPAGMDDLSIGFPTQAPIYSLGISARESEQGSEPRPTNAPLYGESLLANWNGQVRFGLAGQSDAPIYPSVSFALASSMHGEESSAQGR